jgi:D-glycero-D-manno-heptose 1,7-bisphosphate phosphatase
VLKGLKLLQKKDYLIFIITNQAGIAKKKFSENDFEKLHLKFKDFHLKNGILINDLVYCPYHKESKIKKYRIDSDWRKPNNGMIRHLLKNYDINMSKSFMIGDNESDKKCANKSKIYFEYSKKNFYTQVKNILERRNYDKK